MSMNEEPFDYVSFEDAPLDLPSEEHVQLSPVRVKAIRRKLKQFPSIYWKKSNDGVDGKSELYIMEGLLRAG